MKIDPVIAHIRAQVAAFEDRVAGAAEFSAAFEQDNVAVPHAFVVPLGDVAQADQTAGAVFQGVEEQIGVIVCLSNTGDLRGQAAGEALEDFRLALHAALLGWRAPDMDTGFEYRGGQLMEMTRARLWHEFTFAAQSSVQQV